MFVTELVARYFTYARPHGACTVLHLFFEPVIIGGCSGISYMERNLVILFVCTEPGDPGMLEEEKGSMLHITCHIFLFNQSLKTHATLSGGQKVNMIFISVLVCLNLTHVIHTGKVHVQIV